MEVVVLEKWEVMRLAAEVDEWVKLGKAVVGEPKGFAVVVEVRFGNGARWKRGFAREVKS